MLEIGEFLVESSSVLDVCGGVSPPRRRKNRAVVPRQGECWVLDDARGKRLISAPCKNVKTLLQRETMR